MPRRLRRGPWPRRLVVHGADAERQVDDLRAVVVGARIASATSLSVVKPSVSAAR
jgi:hypothetical protein